MAQLGRFRGKSGVWGISGKGSKCLTKKGQKRQGPILTVDDEVESGADLLPVVEGVADAAGVVLDGVGEVGADDVQVARRGNHVVLAIWGRIV